MSKNLELAKEKLLIKEKRLELMQGLPHLYGWKWYPWAKEFFDSTNKINLLVAANQISKSSTQIRKAIDWATNTALWPELWIQAPNQFWYMYPSAAQITTEFQTKWMQFLPSGRYKTDKYVDDAINPYQWRLEMNNKIPSAIYFPNTGCRIYFKSYTQKAAVLQSSTVYAVFADEEMPEDLFDEVMFRLSATSGYFNMVFTATLGQEFWRRAMQPKDFEEESLPSAHKQIVSMYDCLKYLDGSPSHWTLEKIEQVKQRCSSDNEIMKRVYGHFIKEVDGLKYPQFNPTEHMVPKRDIPKDWLIFVGVDIGSGGENGHKSAICFVAVSPDFTRGRVIKLWRGDDILTTASDVVNKYFEMKKELGLPIEGKFYDWSNKDFFTIAESMGEVFLMAEKSHAKGEEIVNTLFKNNMLMIDVGPDSHKLAGELMSIRLYQNKRKAEDDLADALRYAITRVPWDFDAAVVKEKKPAPVVKELTDEEKDQIERRKRFEYNEDDAAYQSIEDEFEETNDLYGF